MLRQVCALITCGHLSQRSSTDKLRAKLPNGILRQLNKADKISFQGVHDKSITVTGNTVIDALRWTLARSNLILLELLA